MSARKVLRIDCYAAVGGEPKRITVNYPDVLPPEYIKIENRVFHRSAWRSGGKSWSYREHQGPEPNSTVLIKPIA